MKLYLNILFILFCSLFQETQAFAQAALEDKVPLYRYFNAETGDHYFTTTLREDGEDGYKSEGIACEVFMTQQAGTVPLYGYFKEKNGIADHYLTTDINVLGPDGNWGYYPEGIICYVYPNRKTGSIPLYSYYNRDIKDHHFTTNSKEFSKGNRNGYVFKKIACYVPSKSSKITGILSNTFNKIDMVSSLDKETELREPSRNLESGEGYLSFFNQSRLVANLEFWMTIGDRKEHVNKMVSAGQSIEFFLPSEATDIRLLVVGLGAMDKEKLDVNYSSSKGVKKMYSAHGTILNVEFRVSPL